MMQISGMKGLHLFTLPCKAIHGVIKWYPIQDKVQPLSFDYKNVLHLLVYI